MARTNPFISQASGKRGAGVFGNGQNGSHRPDVQRIQNDRRSRFNPIATLTPTRLTTDIQSWDLGYMAYLALLFDAVERRDENISTVAPRRYEAPSNLDWDILINEEESENIAALRQQAALRYFYNNITTTDALYMDKRGGVSALLRQMNRAVGHFYSVHETIWRPQDPIWEESTDPNSKKKIVRLKAGLSAEFRLCPNWWFECITGKLRYLSFNFDAYGADMFEEEWLVTVGQGILLPSVINYLFQKMSLNDWVIYNRDFGRPLVDAVTDAAKDSPEWDDFLEALRSIFGAGIVLHSRSGEVKFNKATEGTEAFDKLLDRLEKRIIRMWRGGEMHQKSSGQGEHGSHLQDKEGEKILKADSRQLEETLNSKTDRQVLQWYFGASVIPLAYFRLLSPKNQDDSKEMATDQALVNMGAQMTIGKVAERYGRTVLNGDDLCEKAQPVTPADGGAGFANTRPAGASDKLRKNLLISLGALQGEQFKPLADEINRILAIKDDASMLVEFQQLYTTRGKWFAKTNPSPQFRKTFADGLGAEIVNGMVTAAKQQSASAKATADKKEKTR